MGKSGLKMNIIVIVLMSTKVVMMFAICEGLRHCRRRGTRCPHEGRQEGG